MAAFADVFQRKEVKYVLDEHQRAFIVDALSKWGGLAPDEFGCGRVTSLYLDTADRSLIDRSLEKPLYKEKLRVRWYGDLADDAPVFVEVKKKFKGIVYKRRVACSRKAAYSYLKGEPYDQACERFPLADAEQAEASLSPRSLQTAHEIDQVLRRYRPLSPSMLITCLRTAYVASDTAPVDASDVRVTFDEELAYRDLRETASGAHAFVPILPEGSVVMEVKARGSFPLWLSHALAACEAYPRSFSKYGSAYLACKNASRSRGQRRLARPQRELGNATYAKSRAQKAGSSNEGRR